MQRGALFAGHGVPADRLEAFRQGLHGGADGRLGRAQVQDHRRPRNPAGQGFELVEDDLHRGGQHHQIDLFEQAAGLGGQLIRQADLTGQAQGGRVGVDAGDTPAAPLERQGQRPAHQAQADHGQAAG